MQYPNAIRFGLFFAVAVIFQGPVQAENEYPAAYFEPYIIYQAPEVAGNASAESESSPSGAAPAEAPSEPQEVNPYPAAYFEPVIVYQDKDLIAAQAKQQAAKPEPAPAGKPEASSETRNPAPAEAASPPVSEKGGFPIGVLLLIAALAGGLYWMIYRKQDGAPAETSIEAAVAGTDAAPASDDSGEPGVQEETPEAP